METHSIIMSKILETSENSYFRWKKKDHVILVNLLEKYFTKEDLKEFLVAGKITKFENLKLIEMIEVQLEHKLFTLDDETILLVFSILYVIKQKELDRRYSKRISVLGSAMKYQDFNDEMLSEDVELEVKIMLENIKDKIDLNYFLFLAKNFLYNLSYIEIQFIIAKEEKELKVEIEKLFSELKVTQQ